MKRMSLIQIKSNHKGKIVDVLGGANLQKRLMHMGVYKGREVIKLSHIGLRGPVVIKSGKTILALGHNIAARVMVGIE